MAEGKCGLEWRLAKIEAAVNSIAESVGSLGTWVFVGVALGVTVGAVVGAFIADAAAGVETENAAEALAEAYTEGYRQGVMDALGDPERALAQLLCTGDYNATVTIDGMEFTLSCTSGG